MSDTEAYVVRQGDHLARLAAARGLSPDTVWNLADNADLKKLRTTYNVLLPGDVICFPLDRRKFLSVNVGATNTFVGTLPTCTIVHTFRVDDQPLAGAKFQVLDVGGDPLVTPAPSTDGSGTATFDVPVEVEQVQVVFDGGLTFVLGVGHLDPASSFTGCMQRLQHLGYLSADPNDPDAASPAWVGLALAAFQRDQGIEATGVLDDATSAKLASVYGL